MAWYPGAQKLELQPESDSQPAIRPTQLIFHSIAAPWTPQRTYEFWRDSTNLESHFGLGYDGVVAQYIGTETRADANYLANRRADGTGAISLESASIDTHTDPWTPAQVETLIRLGVWAHHQHGIPLRICRTASDPGYGYHRLHADWAIGGTACPGDARVRQFNEVVFPAIVARANGAPDPTTPAPNPAPTEEELMTPEEKSWLDSWFGQLNAMAWGQKNDTAAQSATIEALVKMVASTKGLDPAAVGAAVKQAVTEALQANAVDVNVTVHDKTTTPKAG
jgi:hypothetical protein